MTPERVSPHGSFRLELRFKGVGEIRIASGARTETEFREIVSLLRKLERTHRIDLLRAVKERRVTIAELLAADDAQRLDSVLVDARLHQRLWPSDGEGKRHPGAFERALAAMRCGRCDQGPVSHQPQRAGPRRGARTGGAR